MFKVEGKLKNKGIKLLKLIKDMNSCNVDKSHGEFLGEMDLQRGIETNSWHDFEQGISSLEKDFQEVGKNIKHIYDNDPETFKWAKNKTKKIRKLIERNYSLNERLERFFRRKNRFLYAIWILPQWGRCLTEFPKIKSFIEKSLNFIISVIVALFKTILLWAIPLYLFHKYESYNEWDFEKIWIPLTIAVVATFGTILTFKNKVWIAREKIDKFVQKKLYEDFVKECIKIPK